MAETNIPYLHGFHEFWEVALHVARGKAKDGFPLTPKQENEVIGGVIEKYRDGAWKFKPCPVCQAEIKAKSEKGVDPFICPTQVKLQIQEAIEKWNKRDRIFL